MKKFNHAQIIPNFLILFLFITLVSCSKNNESQNTNSGNSSSLVHEIPTQTSEEAKNIAEDATILCPPESPCHPSVALFIATKKNGVATCTASLVGEDLMLTNSHCIPKEIKESPKNCDGSIRFIFPATTTQKEESVGCKELIGFTQIPHEQNPDFAFIRLEKKLQRTPIAINQQGAPLGKKITIYKIDPIASRSAKGRMVRTVCETAQNTFLFPSFQRSLDPLVVMGGCEESIPGNSGSPALDPSGKLFAVTQASLRPKEESVRQLLLKQMDAGDQIAHFTMATNAVCFNSNLNIWNIHPTCVASEDLPKSPLNGLKVILSDPERSREIEEKISNLLSPYLKNLPQLPLQWNRVAQKNSQLLREFTLAPLCFFPSNLWISDYLNKDQSIKDFAQIKALVPVIATKLILNSSLQPKRADVFVAQENELLYRFNPLALSQTGESLLLQMFGEDNASETTAGFCN